MAESSTTRSGGVGVFSLLGVAFVVLKLCGTITWSWWWVTAPFWGPFAIAIAILIVFGVCAAIVGLFALLVGMFTN